MPWSTRASPQFDAVDDARLSELCGSALALLHGNRASACAFWL